MERKQKPRIKLGDIFEIPLSGGRKTYGQYIFMDKNYGPIVRIFNYFTDKDAEADIDALIKVPLLFPPVIMGIHATVREGIWKVVGNRKVDDFKYPGFLHPQWDPSTGKASKWFLWDGEKEIELGDKVPSQYRDLEILIGYAYDLVAKRIETGAKWGEHLIETNYFRQDQMN